MITLKHLARDYSYDPYKLRMFLRTTFGIRRRWRWDPAKADDMEDLKKIKIAIEATTNPS